MPQNGDTGLRHASNRFESPAALALATIGWIVQDADRAQRYLDLTGLEPDTLRAGLDQPRVLASALDFLANHEPDLMLASDQLGVPPADMITARRELSE